MGVYSLFSYYYKHQWNTKQGFACKHDIFTVKITCYFPKTSENLIFLFLSSCNSYNSYNTNASYSINITYKFMCLESWSGCRGIHKIVTITISEDIFLLLTFILNNCFNFLISIFQIVLKNLLINLYMYMPLFRASDRMRRCGSA